MSVAKPVLIKRILNPPFLFLLAGIIGFFVIFPHSRNFGDHASWGRVYQQTLINYINESNYPGDFYDYFKEKYRFFHQEKLGLPDAYDTYGLDTKVKIYSVLGPEYYGNFIISGFGQLALHYLSFGVLDVETCLALLGLIAFIVNYVYAYKLGKILINWRFGLVLAVLASGNIYFNQLARSMLLPFITFYSPLTFISLYYLVHFYHRRSRKAASAIGLGIALALCFLNGYSNTNVLLLGFIIFLLFLFIPYIAIFKPKHYHLRHPSAYLSVFTVTLFLVFSVTAFWSILFGQHIFYYLDSLLQDRVWGMILGRQTATVSEHMKRFTFGQVPGFLYNLTRALVYSSKDRGLIHEASFLNDLPFFNPLEFIFFIIGAATLLIRFSFKHLFSVLITILLVYSAGRFFTNPGNHIICARYSYDIYFYFVLASAYGLYWLFGRSSKRKLLLWGVLAFCLTVNIAIFNHLFIWRYGETINQGWGVYDLHKLYQQEMSQGKNLIVYHYRNGMWGYMYHIDLISLLENKTDYEVLDKFISQGLIQDKNKFEDYLKKSPYQKIYFIIPSGHYRAGRSVVAAPTETFSSKLSNDAPYFADYPLYKVIKTRRGMVSFWVYKFSKE